MKINRYFFVSMIVLLLISAVSYSIITYAQQNKATMPEENEMCMMCHSDNTLYGTKNGKRYLMYVNEKEYLNSTHANNLCTDCHTDLIGEDFPHKTELEIPKCDACHPKASSEFYSSLHGAAKQKGDPLAPDCGFCHGKHDILYTQDENSKVTPLNIPYLCGTCHREGSEVQMNRDIHQSHIIENYSQSIHGEGLFKKGLTVTATCVSCHTAHNILDHFDSRSSIARGNIAKTCESCHSKIEEVHKKVIAGELWEKSPNQIPACTDCHQPHVIRKSKYEVGLSNNECLSCHSDRSIINSTGMESMYIDKSNITLSVHNNTNCVECHVQASPTIQGRACSTIDKPVNCGGCHENINNEFLMSSHGTRFEKGDDSAPDCKTCHGNHYILSKHNPKSNIFPVNIPELCSQCHNHGEIAAVRLENPDTNFVENYTQSIHGRGLKEQGMTVTATCTDCHSAHFVLGKKHKQSSVHPDNIGETCGNCHWGIQQNFVKSIHSPIINDTNEKLPTCEDCHTSHAITDPTQDEFRASILSTCGQCHEDLSKSYFDTYHGKASLLGSGRAAKCHDCHSSHSILPSDYTESTLYVTNIVNTCESCHPNANMGFTRYLTHATHHDPEKYPLLFITFWGMTFLLLGTFAISWLHTLLWLPRSLKMRKFIKKMHKNSTNNIRVRRFSNSQRVLHIIMVVSFLILAFTGMILKFSNAGWAAYAVKLFGSIETAGYFHRFAALLLFGVFFKHIYDLFKLKKSEYKSWKAMLFSKDSMLPNRKDWDDFKGTLKWFIGKGPRPQYGRWTYWEKFDYFAVFWGIFVIGSTGMMLWFPEFFTIFISGEFLNVATIIHSDEALLAAGFIFTIHFFNTHFRPEKFPMDTVIFTGTYDLDEFKFDRPEEYQKLVETGKLEELYDKPPTPMAVRLSKIFGWSALSFGLLMIIMIVISLFSIIF